jgi:branched-chain amino acid transport system substrate-binding protein
MTLAIVLLVAGLIVGGGVGYYMAPTKTVTVQGQTQTVTVKEAPLKGASIKLGYIASTTTGLETAKPYRDQIISVDMNKYAAKLGYDVKFVWQIDDAQGQAATHLEKVQALKAMSVTVFEGGGWSSMAAAALNYCNTNKMLMWSTSSTSPTLAIKDDYLFRLCPADTALAPALAKMVIGFGYTKCVFMQRGDSWGDGIKNIFETEYKKLGGSFTGDIIRYAGESTEFSNYLATADKQIVEARKTSKVGGILLAFDEAVTICTQAKDYPAVYSTIWFGADGTAKSSRIIEDAGVQGAQMKLMSLLASASTTPKFIDLENRYVALTKLAYSSYSAYQYDVGFILMSSILAKQSSAGVDIYPLQMDAAWNTFGGGGWCQLNEYGDRAAAFFDIWGYALDKSGAPILYNYGSYDQATDTLTWGSVAQGLMG